MADILIIDDSRELLEALRLLLEMEKQTVRTARTAADALALMDSGFMPRLIVCDYDLPDTNGIELVKQLRTHPTYKDIFFVIATGRRDLRKDALNAGANEFLDKPFPMHDFLKLVLPRS